MTMNISQCPLHQTSQGTGEKKLLFIIGISLITMVGEITGGTVFGSMALLADGWHMGTHVLALGIAYGACILARKIARDPRFGFGPGKVSALGGFAGAILLGTVAFEMLSKGMERWFHPEVIQFNEALIVAAIGLLVNTVGAFLLHEGAHAHSAHSHEHDHTHSHNLASHNKGGHGHDANMQSAYLHVITDALTSVLAIAALLLGKRFGWVWADAAVAMLGGIIILKWTVGLLKSSGAALLDFVPNLSVHREIEATIEGDKNNEVQDIHIWPEENRFGLFATVTSHCNAEPAETIHQRLRALGYLKHITIEVRACHCCPQTATAHH
ncbi:MAG: CDF family Co(II)/Ni(II) efflux transporter DmeF [Deltaproteobacteria bacterium]|nr:CDF family Co(II)/Ni(II) efflux transporter DmeF [Deltaproteobacteria bacterium]MBN2673900.1 CDF family Co(II)/Ni(II) efflux transporter DmeF [Deltaproteobacteria bacterium]